MGQGPGRRARVSLHMVGPGEGSGSLAASVVVRRNEAVAERALRGGEGLLLLHRESGAYHRLNPTGTAIWRCLERPLRYDALERSLRANLTGVPESWAEDLKAYLLDLASRDLVRLMPEPPA